MGKALVDNYSKEQLEEIVKQSYSQRDLMDKLKYKSHNGRAYETVRKRLEQYNISTDHFGSKDRVKRNAENIFIQNSTATQAVLRRWYVKGEYTPYKCSICGLEPFWNGKELTLTLDHINGINTDDRLENLRWVCPNCDRQLPTYGRRNSNNLW